MSEKSPRESEQSVINDNKNDKKTDNPSKIKKLSYEGEPLWRIYFNSYIDKEKKLEREDKFNRRKKAALPCQNSDSSQDVYPYDCYPLNILNRRQLDQKQNSYPQDEKIRIWRNMKANPQIDMSSFTSVPEIDLTARECIFDRDQVRELGAVDSKNVDMDDYATCRELGHARVPATCLAAKKTQQIVDRSTGERPGLVDGDYVTCELESKGDYRLVYTQVCLRGTKGMHLIELTREREKTWKFCFYQALVALLAKTQLRYKFATSSNIDYIYDLAWMLFLHVGSLTVNHKLNLDDVVVYNYNYCVEFELVQELKNINKISGSGFRDLGKGVKIKAMKRPELMKMTRELGQEKKKVTLDEPVNEETKEIEQWFNKLPDNCRNCVFKTGKFAIAFWNDGSFWYLYNPYRCDRFGFWNDNGTACLIKFCSRVTLRRHLMILLIQAYGVGNIKSDEDKKEEEIGNLERKNFDNEEEIDSKDEVNLENTGSDFKEDDTFENRTSNEINIENEETNIEDDEKNVEQDEVNLQSTENDLKEDDTVENEDNEDENLTSTEKNLESEEINVIGDEKNVEQDELNLKSTENDLQEDDTVENEDNKNENLTNNENNLKNGEMSIESDEKNAKDQEEIENNDKKNLDNTENLVNEDTSVENDKENLITERINIENIKNEDNNKLTIQIFQVNYNCVKLHNLKLLNKNLLKPKTRLVKKIVDESTLKKSSSDSNSDELKEKPSWLSKNGITWSRISSSLSKQARWHEYLVEEPQKLFSLWGSIHPTGSMFSPENRGKQIHACYLVCLGMSRIMAPEYWSSKTLDTVVMCGDRYYTCSKLQSDGALRNSIDRNNNQRNNADVDGAGSSWASNLTNHFKIGDMLFEVKVLPAICGRLYSRYSLWKILQQMFITHSYGVLTCESSCLGIFKFCGAYYLLDGNSFGPPIFDYGHGVLYLLRATSFLKFIKILILIINSLESSKFSVNPVEILKIIDVGAPSDEIKGKKLIVKNRKFKKNKRLRDAAVM